MARIHDIIEDLFGGNVTEAMILEAFASDHPGFKSHPMAQALRDGVYIHGDFNASSSDCSYVGYFKRWIGKEGRSLVAHHIEIFVDEPYRKQGLAKSHLSRLVRFYDSVGIEYVVLEAAGYGAIVWPQLGFELRELEHKKLLDDQYRSILAELGYEGEPPRSAASLALTPLVEGQPVGLMALDGAYRALDCRPIPMILDLQNDLTRAFLKERGIL